MLEESKETLNHQEGNPENENRLVVRKAQNSEVPIRLLIQQGLPGAGCLVGLPPPGFLWGAQYQLTL